MVSASWCCKVESVLQDLDGKRTDPFRRGIVVPVGSQQVADTGVDFSIIWAVPWVSGPHAGERLCHRMEGVSHRSRSDRLVAEAEASVTDSAGKDKEERDFVMDFG